MRLIKAEIQNFRSISRAAINFFPQCRVLVGINESGKSNILRALSLLDKNRAPNPADVREALPDEGPIVEAFVSFALQLEKQDIDNLFTSAKEFVVYPIESLALATNGTEEFSLRKFIEQVWEVDYVVDLIRRKKSVSISKGTEEWNLLDGWKTPNSSCPDEYQIQIKGEQVPLNSVGLIRSADFPDIPHEYLNEADFDLFLSIIKNEVDDYVLESLPPVVFWEFDPKNLLPSSISYEEFASSPDLCLPLKNMFRLAGVTDIRKNYDTVKAGTTNRMVNDLSRIAARATKYFREVWEDYQNVEFSLQINGDQIVPGVKELNTMDFDRRSDGFKKFVTFLLLISFTQKTGELQGALLLFDEPEASLHPTGARFLRDELIRVSENNLVVYSTHSIYMIDSQDIPRHYIVRKVLERTAIEEAGDSNFSDEEVIYNALGHSAFHVLKEKNLLFEGWYDKSLFRIALDKTTVKNRKIYRDLGIAHANGVKTIRAITPMIQLAAKKCLIISDADKLARDYQKDYVENNGHGNWLRYDEILSGVEAITAEDFLSNSYLLKSLTMVFSEIGLEEFPRSRLPENKGKLKAIEGWLNEIGQSKEGSKQIIRRFKEHVFSNLEKKHIEHKYFTLLDQLAVHATNL